MNSATLAAAAASTATVTPQPGIRRFIMVTSGYPPGATAGLERGCERLARALASRGFDVTVLTVAASDLPAETCNDAGVSVLRVLKPWSLGPLFGLSYILQTALWLWRLRHRWDFAFCQQLYLHSVSAAVVAKRLGKMSGSLLVAADAYSDITRLLAMRGGSQLLKRALSADGLFALSRRSRAELIAAGVEPSRIFSYRYFVDTKVFTPSSEAPSDEFVFMGRFDRQKNVPLLMDAFDRVRAVRRDARLRLIGRGPDEAQVRERARADGAVTVENWTDDPASAYRRARAVVSASDAEGLSNVMIEAMACGAPLIATDVSGARDILGDDGSWPEPLPLGSVQRGIGGLLVNRGDADALARAMLDVLESNALRASLGQEARSSAVAGYSEEITVRAFLANVGELASRWGGGDRRG